MLQLSNRLLAVAGLAGTARVLADVGTDHGYIPVHLAACGKTQGAIAMDINQSPLAHAREHIQQYGLEERIEIRLSDGLSALKPGEADVIVIAGMGGALMTRILSQGRETAHTAERLVLQPQSEIFAFRRFLCEDGYQITAEDMVYEEGKFYPMMRVAPLQAKRDNSGQGLQKEAVSAETAWKYGSLLIQERHPVLEQYLLRQKAQKESILQSLALNARQDVSRRQRQLEQELTEIRELLELWKK